ncbi:adenylyltransferase/cytidyltransferase family protein [Candidatus Woesebacteria bacterium]|nr:adenylyltransferase/cytidyltransferase family protein [Candidatus Woesebacteria bacterium]
MNDLKVLVTGVFDILHEEHIGFLQAAKQLGGILIIGIESDARVKTLKGEGRPINSQKIRKENIEALGVANKVFVLPEKFSTSSEHLQLLQALHPTILAVSESTPHLREKRKLLKQIGGKVVIVRKHNPAISTTKILEKS